MRVCCRVYIYMLLCAVFVPLAASFAIRHETGIRSSTSLYFFNFEKKPEEDLSPSLARPVEEPKPSSIPFDFFNKPETSKIVPKQSTVEKESPPNVKKENLDDEPDFVEKIFRVFFGAKEESPMGLKRFGAADFPEQYPATTTEWADPVEGDDSDVQKLRPLLKNTNLETRRLALAYNANSNGWSPDKFHAAVDKKGPSLVVVTTSSGLVAGGYNPKGWVGYGEARGSIAAFLFVANASGGWTKLRKVGGPSLAQLDIPESGPSFGADSLIIPLAKDNSKVARSKLGSYYERFPDGTNSLFGKGQSSVTLKEFKVYQGVYEPGEYVPFTDAEPFALY
jgi:hypothetical protein